MSGTVLIVDDEENARLAITDYLGPHGFETISVASLAEARSILGRGQADVVVLDVQLDDGYGPSLLNETAQMPMRPPIILMTGHGDINSAVDAMKKGAYDFLQKPLNMSQLEQSIRRALEIVAMRRELSFLRDVQKEELNFIVGSSSKMQALMDGAQRAAEASVSVLITGETGTGKEVLGRAIHKMGPRASKPFMDINCAAIQSTVIESELFGYEAGAFTSAERRKLGLMEVADGGILWLDEIASMSVDMQAKLLRAIEEQSFRRVGGTNLIHVDVQVMAASNRSLPNLIEVGEFREDLYYRLKVVNLEIPPLRERKEDIPDLVGFYIKFYNQKLGKNIQDISPRAMNALTEYRWPGNIRELKNAIYHAMLYCDEACIDLPHFPSELG